MSVGVVQMFTMTVAIPVHTWAAFPAPDPPCSRAIVYTIIDVSTVIAFLLAAIHI
jgi:hypothetical protein